MPNQKKKGDSSKPPKKKIALKPSRKKASTKKGPAKGKRGERDLASRTLGETVRKRIKLDEDLPEFEATPGIKKTGLDSLISGETIKANNQFNASFRALGPSMDEFFSTATMREFVKGLIGDKKWSEYDEEEQKYLGELVDILSAIRVPTKFVGFSLDTGILQHPTSPDEGYFAHPYATASKHAELDKARREYVQSAADAAVQRGENARGIVISAGRAAIEFTLNNFMAPISASNVQPHSKLASAELTDEKVLEQLKWREFLKEFYVDVLGGKLRTLTTKESKKASRQRIWNPQSDFKQFAPPSPARNVEEGEINEEDEEEDKGVGEKIELDDITAAQPDPLDSALEESGLNVFGQSVSGSSEGFPFSDPDFDQYGSASFLPSDFDYGGDFTFGSDEPSQFGSSGLNPSVSQDASFQFGGGGQSQFGQSSSFNASDQFTSSLTEEAMEQDVVQEMVLEFL